MAGSVAQAKFVYHQSHESPATLEVACKPRVAGDSKPYHPLDPDFDTESTASHAGPTNHSQKQRLHRQVQRVKQWEEGVRERREGVGALLAQAPESSAETTRGQVVPPLHAGSKKCLLQARQPARRRRMQSALAQSMMLFTGLPRSRSIQSLAPSVLLECVL